MIIDNKFKDKNIIEIEKAFKKHAVNKVFRTNYINAGDEVSLDALIDAKRRNVNGKINFINSHISVGQSEFFPIDNIVNIYKRDTLIYTDEKFEENHNYISRKEKIERYEDFPEFKADFIKEETNKIFLDNIDIPDYNKILELKKN
jgi:hypothetical protein